MPNDWNTALKSNIYYLLINFLSIKYDICQIITQTFKIWFTIFNLLDVINVRVISGTFQKLGNIATNSLLARPFLSSSCMRSNDKESQNLLSAFISRCVLKKIFLTLQMVNGEGCFREAFNRKKRKYIGLLPILRGGGVPPDQYISVFSSDKTFIAYK